MALEHLTEFDEIIRSTLEGVEESVPSSVWSQISDKLDAIAGAAAAAGTAISSASSGSAAASGSAATGSAVGSAATGSAAGSAATGSAVGSAATGSAVTGSVAASGSAVAGSSAAGAAAGAAATAASSNALTIALASVAAAGVIGGGTALVLTNSNNQHIDEPKLVTEVVQNQDTSAAEMPEDTIDLVQYVRHQIPVIDEEPQEEAPVEEPVPAKEEKNEQEVRKEPPPKLEKPEVEWNIQPKKSQNRFAIGAGYINSLDRSKVEIGYNGFYVGISYNFPINGNMGIAPGIYYSYVTKNHARRWEDFQFYLSEDGAKITEHYLDFPVYFNYRYDVSNDVAFRAFAGPTFSLGLSSSIEYDGKTYNAFDSDYSRFDVMLGGGLTFEYRKKYNFHIGYDFGLLNKNTGDSGPHHKRNKFYVGLGYMF